MNTNEFLNALMDAEKAFQFGGWLRDIGKDTTVWSRGMYHLLGIHPSVPPTHELYSRSIHLDDRHATSHPRAPNDEPTLGRVVRLVRPDGSLRSVRAFVHDVKGPIGTPSQQLGLLIDATEVQDRDSVAEYLMVKLGLLERRSDQANAGTAELLPYSPLNPALIRAARGLLDWSAQDLAAATGLSFSTIRRSEQPMNRKIKLESGATIRRVLEAQGLRFVTTGRSTGVLCRASEKDNS